MSGEGITQPSYSTGLAVGDVTGRRAAMDRVLSQAPKAEMPPDVKETIFTVEAEDGLSINLHRFQSVSKSLQGRCLEPAVLFIHGGGYVLGSVEDNKRSIFERLADGGIQEFAVEYRLAPEYPYPAPLHDCYAALLWLHSHAMEMGIDSTRIGVLGHSAGGGLAASLALLARDRSHPSLIKRQMLIYPMLDDRTQPGEDEGGYFGDAADNATGWRAYIGENIGPLHQVSQYAAPARAVDLSGLPPTYIDVGTLDFFWAENLAFARNLAKARVSIEFHLLPGLQHGWEALQPSPAQLSQATDLRRAFISRM